MSFADAPSATAQAAHTVNVNADVDRDPAAQEQQQLCVVIPTPFDDGEATPINTPTPASASVEGASVVEVGSLSPIQAALVGDDDCDGDGDDDLLSRSSPGPLAGMTLIDSLPLGAYDHDHEGGGESTAWELSSSSGDENDGPNVFSATRWEGKGRPRRREYLSDIVMFILELVRGKMCGMCGSAVVACVRQMRRWDGRIPRLCPIMSSRVVQVLFQASQGLRGVRSWSVGHTLQPATFWLATVDVRRFYSRLHAAALLRQIAGGSLDDELFTCSYHTQALLTLAPDTIIVWSSLTGADALL